MQIKLYFPAALLAASLLVLPAFVRAEDTTPAGKSGAAEKAPEKTPPAESTTQGTVDTAGQHIAYTAIAGTITVGANDAQDTQLGPERKPQAGSQVLLNEPKVA